MINNSGFTIKSFIVIHGKRQDSTKLLYFLKNCIEHDAQTIVVDMSRRWQPDEKNKRIRYIRPNSISEFIRFISELHYYINPRLNLIIVDGIVQFLRDYLGKQAKDNIRNEKIYAYIISLLKNINSEYHKKIILTSYQSGFDRNQPIFHSINEYYGIEEIDITSY